MEQGGNGNGKSSAGTEEGGARNDTYLADIEKGSGGNDTSASGNDKGGDVAVDTSSENLTSTSTSARGNSPSKGNKKSTNHTPKPTSQ